MVGRDRVGGWRSLNGSERAENDAVEAVSWLVAARVYGDLGAGYELTKLHAMDGQYDVLSLRGGRYGPAVMLNRRGLYRCTSPETAWRYSAIQASGGNSPRAIGQWARSRTPFSES